MKTTSLVLLAVGIFALAGCQQKLTLEEAQAQCEKKDGLLVLVYTQKITASGPGEQVVSPGDCVTADKFGVDAAPPGAPPAAQPSVK